jgi:ZIP family zinc transporter
MTTDSPKGRFPTFIMLLLPLLLLAGLLWILKSYDPTQIFKTSFPPIEELTIQRVILSPHEITVKVVNGGPQPVTIAQTLVDSAYWIHEIEPAREIPRLGHATVTIPYHWVEGETHVVALMTSSGLLFEHEIAVAVESPQPSRAYFFVFTLLGLYVGVIPVGIGLLWFPALRNINRRWLDFFLWLTIGLLVFLGVDAFEEAFEVSENLPGPYQGLALILIGAVGSFVVLSVLQRSMGHRRKTGEVTSLIGLSYMVALGIGLHNLSEGLAIGAAFSLGDISLGTLLVVGFMLHNTTEGLAIISPLARGGVGVGIKHLFFLGALGGAPTILGTWLGGFIYSDLVALLFLAIGAGAIFQVAYQIAGQMAAREGEGSEIFTPANMFGLLSGFLIMFATGLMVAV